ncbi:MAG: phage tail protein [Chitinophagaceae bacterium]|nr:phage tail protein [Chitinophagaceae bacterium]
MLLQLGNKVYEGLFVPSTISYSGNEANLAQYDLINTKPRLQFTGNTLEEVTLQFKLRIEFCTPAQEIKDLEAWKSTGEILPLLLGNGEYVNDYVIKSVGKEITQTFNDGTIVEVDITISLLEYVPGSEEEQQAASDRRKAAAVGYKKQVIRRPTQKPTSEAQAHTALMEAQNKSWEAAEEAEKMKNADVPEEHISKVQSKVAMAQAALEDARNKISEVQENITVATGVIASVNKAKDKLTEIGNLMQPPVSLTALNDSILNLQTGLRGVNDAAIPFTNDIILRKM